MNKNINSMERWKTGHHIFYYIIQTLIIVHRDILLALQQGKNMEISNLLNLAKDLLYASISSFKLTADYPEGDYDAIIRPSMSPPHYSVGFSGTEGIDHLVLLEVIKELKHIFHDLPSNAQIPHQGYVLAMKTLYEVHALICESFIGHSNLSLKQSKIKSSAKITGPESLRKYFKTKTLNMIDNTQKH
jgi:hypothetical protein